MNHYDTLGLKPDATADEIRAAFRRCASKAHPDRQGGSNERMQAVNRAYAVLSDAAARERYDRTGIDDGAKTLEEMAAELLGAAFEAALDDGVEPVRAAKVRLQQTRERLDQAMRQNSKARSTLERRSGKTKVKSGPNLVQSIIDRRLAALLQQSAQIHEAITCNGKARELLDLYEAEPEEPTIVYDLPGAIQYMAAPRGWR